MSKVAVVAHARKSLGGGLPELRQVLACEGVTDPLWYEVRKSRKAAKRARQAAAEGADLIVVWGGDGTVQRCLDALAGMGAAIAILPAGTANLLATNLNIPSHDVAAAVRVALHGDRRAIDTGSVNGEHFAVMAGAGFDASMIAGADRGLKDRLGPFTPGPRISSPAACARRSRSIAGASSRAGSLACWPETSAGSWAASRFSRRHSPTTGFCDWESSRPPTRSTGCGPWGLWPQPPAAQARRAGRGVGRGVGWLFLIPAVAMPALAALSVSTAASTAPPAG